MVRVDDAVEVREVGPRDGLQGRPAPGEDVRRRADLVRRLAATGLRRIEVGSFVSERAVPQMAGTAEVVDAVADLDIDVEVLVVNEAGARRAGATTCDAVVAVVAATEAFSLRNVRATRADAMRSARAIVHAAHDAGQRAIANVSVAFGCPDEGEVEADRVVGIVTDLVAGGFDEVWLSDTIGVAAPPQIAAVVKAVSAVLPVSSLGLHLHDTRGLGIANVVAGIEHGVRRFDSSIGGIGGCPFAPGASGNVATEDVVHLIHRLGLDCEVRLDDVIGVARWLGEALGIDLPSHLSKARPWSGAR